MIAEIGQFALVLALIIAGVQVVVPMVGAARGDGTLMAFGSRMAVAQAVLLILAFAALTHGFVVSDFSLALVFQNSHSLKPMLYKVSGVWGNHEGSMLMWVLILAVYGAAVAVFGRNLPPTLKARVLSVQAMIGVAFLAFIVFTSNPFLRLNPAPPDGTGLNPLLQDPGLAFHPPLLYLGYVGFSMAFSFAVAALIEGRIDAAWGRWVRPWTLAAWVFLTGGIALGSWWAYYELGWGGWWFWDPVENASFMPWLFGTALLHSSIVVEKRDSLKSWTILLAILTFSMSLLGTFLVRSGVLTSVHTFASDPARGIFILMILLVTVGGALSLFAWRAPTIRGGGLFAPVSREGALVLNNMLLTLASATVLLGTLYPLILDAASSGASRVSVGPPYFNATFAPIMVPLVAAMAIGPLLAWKRGNLRAAARKLMLAAAAAIAAIAATFIAVPDGPALAPFAIGLAAWIATGTLVEWSARIKLFAAPAAESWRRLTGLPRAASGMTLAHLGLAIMIAGITGASAWRSELITTLAVGETAQVKNYALTLQAVENGRGPNYNFERGTFLLTDRNGATIVMYPERRFFPVAGQSTTEAAIKTTLMADLYAVLGTSRTTPEGTEQWTVRFFINPMVPWIWLGALVMVGGGLLSLSDRRHRVGAPRRKQQHAPGVSGAPAPAE
ncbi:MAG: heme lyase CcmF/NrfE family subunit [Alphaproteobacteria bacterium]|nr:heme lyase CcmF/NrfE family subunit [Alphaproteobacteria bacterium]MCZ6592289.1 heme lyase CcmF/NrfE family subunit [Alphaproteobacteria bacterium]